MSNEESEQRIYRLAKEHYEWADLDDLQPDRPETPQELRPWYPTEEKVKDVDDLTIYAYDDEEATFAEESAAFEATPEELAGWLGVYAGVEEAQQKYRARMEAARAAFETAHRAALVELGMAVEDFRPVEEELKARTLELAERLNAHRKAADKWKAEQFEKEQAHLDTIHGPRVIVLNEPNSLGSNKKVDHIAKVHLVDCKRRRKTSTSPIRANEAWEKLTHPEEWIRGIWYGSAKNMRVKLCSFCKPWTVLIEHADVTPKMLHTEIKLTEWPEGLEW